MIVTWFLSGLSVLFHLHLVVERSRLKVGTITSLQTVVSSQLALVFSVYTFNILESHSDLGAFNASYDSVSFFIMAALLVVDCCELAIRAVLFASPQNVV